jgi:hypothetical protein
MFDTRTVGIKDLNDSEVRFLIAYEFQGYDVFGAIKFAQSERSFRFMVKNFGFTEYLLETEWSLQNRASNTGHNFWKLSDTLNNAIFFNTENDGMYEAICRAVLIAKKNDDSFTVPICAQLKNV